MIDIINAHLPYYDNIVLVTGFLNPRETPLDPKVKVEMLTKYKRSSATKRILTWFGFWFQSLYYVFVKYRDYKLYFVSNPPLNVLTARFTKRNFAFLFYDIYPEALVLNSIISQNSFIYKYWQNINQVIYRKSNRIFTLSQGMKNLMKIPDKYSNKADIVPVWTNNTFFKNVPKSDNIFIKQNDLKDKFIVSYSGNLGKTHPVEKLIDVALKLVDHEDIMILIIGEGEKKNMLLDKQQKFMLKNLKILDFQPTELFPQVLFAADIGVVTLEADSADLSVPSKTYNLMSVGKPILTIADHRSELAQIVEGNQMGKNFQENQIEEMVSFIIELKENVSLCTYMQDKSKQTSLKFTPDNAKQMILK
jgi:glycosyltransferase involved in cell wall biosynthesis